MHKCTCDLCISGKISALQSHVDETERNLEREKASALAKLKEDHDKQIKFLKDK